MFSPDVCYNVCLGAHQLDGCFEFSLPSMIKVRNYISVYLDSLFFKNGVCHCTCLLCV